MTDLSADRHTLSEFKRKTSEFISRLKANGDPVVLTVNGKAELVVQDAASYQRLMALAKRAEMMEFILESYENIRAGQTESAYAALQRLGEKYKLNRKDQ